MKENVLNLVSEAKKLINDFENYIYENFKEKYVNSKCVLDRNKENIEIIERDIDSVDLDEATLDLTKIIDSINEAKETLLNPAEETIINNSVPELNDETIQMEEAIENTIQDLDNSFENTTFEPDEIIDDQILDDNTIIEDNIDEDAINAFLSDNNLDV